MKITVWAAWMDMGDGSSIIRIFNTKEEALHELQRTEEEVANGTFYDDGLLKKIVFDVDVDGNLLKPIYLDTDV